MAVSEMNTPRNGRILALLTLVDEAPTVDDLDEYLADPDPEVRSTALAVLSEAAEDWALASPVFAAALVDQDPSVRRRACELLGELREVLLPGEGFAAALREAMTHDDPSVRVIAVSALWRHRLTSVAELTSRMSDPSEQVRCEVIVGLVSLDALAALDQAASDESVRVRIVTARGIAAVGDPRGMTSLAGLAEDPDPLVRAAALSGMAETGCTGRAADLAVAALADAAWQVRQGAATALLAADPGTGVDALVTASADENLDVRKASVRALAAWASGRPQVRTALETAQTDADADVRAIARAGVASAEAATEPET